MKFLNLMQHTALIIIIILISINNDFVVHGRESLDIRLNENNILPHHYDISLNLQILESRADATVDIEIDIRNKTKTIYLHAASNIHIVLCQINRDFNGHIQSASQMIYDPVSEIQMLDFMDYLYPEKYTLFIYYSVHLNDLMEQVDIPYSFRPENSDKYFQITETYNFVFNARLNSTRKIFPCWDAPLFKSTFNISVLLPTYYNVFSCMPIIISKLELENDSRKFITFDKTPVIPTYLVGIFITKLNLISEHLGGIILWYNLQSTNITFVRDVANDVQQSLISNSNYSPIFSKIDIIILPGDHQIIQKWGLSVYSVDAIRYNEEFDSFERKVNVAATIARGVMDQLLGNVVSPSHSRLHEGMVSFFQLKAFAKVFETFPTDIFIIRLADDNNTDPLIQNIMYGNHRKNITPPSVTRYNRVPFILRMLQHLMSDRMFRNGINSYLQQYELGLGDPLDLWSAFKYDEWHISYEDVPRSLAYRLKNAIDACFLQKKDFVLFVTRNYISGLAHMYLQTLDEVNENNSNWTVPLTYTLRSAPDFADPSFYFLDPFRKHTFYIGTNKIDWIIVNLQRIGCYRVQYDSTNWEAIAHHLNHDDYSKIHVLNRAQIIDDAFYFMVKRKITFPLFLRIISYLKRETDYTVWYCMEPVVKYIWDINKNSQYSKIKHFMSEIWDGLLVDVGYYEQIKDTYATRMKRKFALKWACKFGHIDCRRMAAKEMKSYLDNREYEMDPQFTTREQWILCMGMMTADTETLHYMMNKHMYIGKDILRFLACCENERTIIYYLRILLLHDSEEFLINNKTCSSAYNFIVQQHAEKHNVLVYILQNFKGFQLISGSSMMDAMANIINNTYSGRNLYMISEYLNEDYLFMSILNDAAKLIDWRLAQVQKDMGYFTL